jgi:hypothetical protein
MRSAAAIALVAGLLAPSTASAAPASLEMPTLGGQPTERDGFHFQVAFGWGGGPTSHGLFHNMEIGGTFANGWTLAYNHVFIQSGGFYKPEGQPDLFGGHLLLLKIPLWYSDLVGKVAAGLGGTHDQSNGIKAYLGFGWAYGVDVNIPMTRTSGVTLGLTLLHAVVVTHGHHFGGALSLGYTWF